MVWSICFWWFVDDVVDSLDEFLWAEGFGDVVADVQVVEVGFDAAAASRRDQHDANR